MTVDFSLETRDQKEVAKYFANKKSWKKELPAQNSIFNENIFQE